LKLVVTTESPAFAKATAGRAKPNLALQGDALQSYPVVKYCIENKIPYLSVQNLKDQNTKYKIQNTKATVAVLADFGLIIPKEILNVFPKGIINIHPSLLPKYRGPTPVQTAILNGDKVTGVSIMRVDEKIDHGPILRQEKEEILDTDTSVSLYKKLFDKGATLLSKTIGLYLEGKLKPTAQNHVKATFTQPLSRQDGFVDLSTTNYKLLTANLKKMIRAYYPWPSVWSKLDVSSQKLAVRIKFLPGNLIQVEGKKPISYKDFLNGYPEAKEMLSKITPS
ncbi:MAG: methionyl-tRNA formyltransferase, partial [Candidatus Levybacteria bacterium]|nr:methionyl-tRNA formyltransferase [Candidatus Levybacteria bacterium]